MRDFTKYEVWRDAISLAENVYEITKEFPKEEQFGITIQIRRAVVSISSNISEGASRNSEKDFKRFIEIAIGSANELKTQLIISQRLNYLMEERSTSIIEHIDSICRQLNGLRNKLKQ